MYNRMSLHRICPPRRAAHALATTLCYAMQMEEPREHRAGDGWYLSVDWGASWVRYSSLVGVEAALRIAGRPVSETKMMHMHWRREDLATGRTPSKRVFEPLPRGVSFHSGAYHLAETGRSAEA